MNVIDRVYKGEIKLWKTFWYGYAIPLIPISIATNILRETSHLYSSWITYLSIGILFLYNVWIGIGLFRCAPNVRYRVFFWVGRFFSVAILLFTLVSISKLFSR